MTCCGDIIMRARIIRDQYRNEKYQPTRHDDPVLSMRACGFFTATGLLLILAACASNNILELDLMPAPEVYDKDGFNPLADADPIAELPYEGVLYATDRQPAQEGDRERFYLNDRGEYLRLGVARVSVADVDMTWEEARRVTLLKNRSSKYPLSISEVEEYGGLDRTLGFHLTPDTIGDDPHAPAARYAAAVNMQLAKSRRKDVYIYVHGYKVVFENPALVATELWHFLGYDGVFIAYAWPSTPSKWAYLKDAETAGGFARNLRLFLEFLSEETDAEQIHVLGYSAGTRLVARAFEQLALIHQDKTSEEIGKKLRIGNLILVGSDIDRHVFVNYLNDGVLDVPDHLSIYMSGNDKALDYSQLLTRRERLGQLLGDITPEVDAFLIEQSSRMSLIDVTAAEGSAVGNGHGYFRNSPWASSDILMTLMYDLRPADRGLVRADGSPVWTFPPDYIERLRVALAEMNPLFANDRAGDN
jgi:esterase/lipase superfamily enzyme